jgi:hypothetical protein
MHRHFVPDEAAGCPTIRHIPAHVERSCRLASGIDGSPFDEDDDAVRELRLAPCSALGRAITMQLEPGCCQLPCELPPKGGTRPGLHEALSD